MKRLASFAFALAATTAGAQERILTPLRAQNVDGVVTQCVSFVRYDFANSMCDIIAAGIGQYAAANFLPHAYLGRTEWGFGADSYIPTPANLSFVAPLHLTFYIRATDDPPSMNVWLSLYRDFGKDGRLVYWEDSGIGAGDTFSVAQRLADGLVLKMQPVFQTIGAAN